MMESQATKTTVESGDVIDLSQWQDKAKISSPTRDQKRLLQLYIEEVKSQGICDYPSLVAVMQKAYQVQSDPSLLLPSEVTALLGNLAHYQETQSQIADHLRRSMDELGNVFDDKSIVTNPDHLRPVMDGMCEALEQLAGIVIQFQGLVQRFQTLPTKWWHWFFPLDSESQQLFHLCESLRYCHRYLVSQLSLGTLVKAKQENMDWTVFAKRLYTYVDESISVTGQLTTLLRQRIEERQPS